MLGNGAGPEFAIEPPRPVFVSQPSREEQVAPVGYGEVEHLAQRADVTVGAANAPSACPGAWGQD